MRFASVVSLSSAMARRSRSASLKASSKTVFDAKTGELLGAHMIGAEVTELIQGYAIAKTMEGTEQDLMVTIFPHPTLSEMMHESVLDALRPRAPYLTPTLALRGWKASSR